MTIGRTLTVATVFAVLIYVGIDAMSSSADAAIGAADAHADTATVQLLRLARQSHADEVKFGEINAAAERRVAIAEAAGREIRRAAAVLASSVQADTPSTGDTTAIVTIKTPTHPGTWRIPQFMVDDVNGIIREAQQLEQGFEASERARVFAVDTLIPDYKRQLDGADSVIVALRHSIDVRDKVRRPRCGAKCGAVIGTAATVITLLLAHATVTR